MYKCLTSSFGAFCLLGPRLPVRRGSDGAAAQAPPATSSKAWPPPPSFPSLPLGLVPTGAIGFGVGWLLSFFPPQHLQYSSRPGLKARHPLRDQGRKAPLQKEGLTLSLCETPASKEESHRVGVFFIQPALGFYVLIACVCQST